MHGIATQREWTRASLASLRQRARDDVNVFAELCFRDDQTPGDPPFRQQWFHRQWQDAWRTQQVTVIHGATGFGKTEQIIARLLWLMGRRPSIRIVLLGKKAENAAQLLRKIKRQIEENERLRWVFPELRPGKPWNEEMLRVAAAGIDTTTNTVTVYGLDGSPQGVRGDEIIADDILDFENTLTEYQREKTIRFVDSVVQSRLTTTGQLHVMVNAWHPADLAFTYARRPGIWYGRYPAINDAGELLWPDFRPRSWLEVKRGTMSDPEFARMYLCQPRDESTRVFKVEWIEAAKKKGRGLKPMRSVQHVTDRWGRVTADVISFGAAVQSELQVVVGADLATGDTKRQKRGDNSAYVTTGVRPNGDRQLLWVEKGRWGPHEKFSRLRDHDVRYRPVKVLVEDNGMQADLVQIAQHMDGLGERIEPFHTSTEKWHESNGIEGIGLEMRAGRWIIPGPAEGESEAAYVARLTAEEREAYANIQALCQHLLDFARGVHTDDDVMALYFAKEGARQLVDFTFLHTHASEMVPIPPEEILRKTAGDAATAHGALDIPEPEPELPPWLRVR